MTTQNINLGKSFETFKKQIMKVTITKVIVPGSDPYFQVRKDDNIISLFSYRPEAPEGDIYNEATNLVKAKELATKLEMGATRVEEIIYETPADDLPASTFGKD